jgi:hypothetical protein
MLDQGHWHLPSWLVNKYSLLPKTWTATSAHVFFVKVLHNTP